MAGNRYYSDASIYNQGVSINLWTSSLDGSTPISRYLSSASSGAGTTESSNGLCVRCIKD